jgi:very-short-patch-repair endonuclease
MDCLPDDELLIVMESVVDKGLLSLDEVGAMAAGHGRRVTRLAMRMAPAQSGTETILRLAVSALRRAVRCQVPIPGIGRVDLLADGWLILECDSQRWHLDPKAWADDRRRDRKAAAEGFRVIRLTYDDVVLHLPETIQDIMAAIGHPPGRATRRRLATLLGTA